MCRNPTEAYLWTRIEETGPEPFNECYKLIPIDMFWLELSFQMQGNFILDFRVPVSLGNLKQHAVPGPTFFHDSDRQELSWGSRFRRNRGLQFTIVPTTPCCRARIGTTGSIWLVCFIHFYYLSGLWGFWVATPVLNLNWIFSLTILLPNLSPLSKMYSLLFPTHSP